MKADALSPTAECKPSAAISIGIFVAGMVLMTWLRLYLLHDRYVALTYGLPLLVCLWHQDRRLLWSMAAGFIVLATFKAFWLLPRPDAGHFYWWMQWLMQLANTLVIGAAVHAIIGLTRRLRRNNLELEEANQQLRTREEEISRQNEELQQQDEELAGQNEELQQQGEELSRQNEELQQQAEEMEQQSEELQTNAEELRQANAELERREAMLHTLLACMRDSPAEGNIISRVSQALLELIGEPAAAAAVVEKEDDCLLVRAQQGPGHLYPEQRYPLEGSFAAVVMAHDRTAYVDDLASRPDLKVPHPGGRRFRSVLATPLRIHGKPAGAVKVYSLQPHHWTAQHFRIIEWTAAQCALVLELVRLQRELSESRERLSWILDTTGVGLWLNPLPLARLNWDKRTRELFFVPAGVEPTMDLFWSRLHPDDRDPTRLAIETALREHALYSIDHRTVHPDTREIRWIRSVGRAAYDADGKATRFDGINFDVTDRKAFQQELEKLVEERTRSLTETTEQLNDFCYSVAHDLKAPIRAQAAFAHTLAEDFGDVLGEEGRGFALRIKEAAERQGNLVNDLLAHISVGKSELPIEPVDLRGVVALVRSDLEMEIREKQATVSCDTLAGRVMANGASLHLVITNLLTNALKFVPRGTRPEVKVHSEMRDGFVRLSVRDNGIGIPARYSHKLFGVFQRLHTREQYPGTGMGLAIVKRAVERMGGRVGFESRLTKGSCFWVELPAATGTGLQAKPR